MNGLRSCGCKGIRSCLECEQNYGITRKDFQKEFQVRINSHNF